MTKEEAQLEATTKIKQAQDLLNDAKQLAIENQLDLTFELGADADSVHDEGPFKFEITCSGHYPRTEWRPGGWVGSSYDC